MQTLWYSIGTGLKIQRKQSNVMMVIVIIIKKIKMKWCYSNFGRQIYLY